MDLRLNEENDLEIWTRNAAAEKPVRLGKNKILWSIYSTQRIFDCIFTCLFVVFSGCLFYLVFFWFIDFYSGHTMCECIFQTNYCVAHMKNIIHSFAAISYAFFLYDGVIACLFDIFYGKCIFIQKIYKQIDSHRSNETRFFSLSLCVCTRMAISVSADKITVECRYDFFLFPFTKEQYFVLKGILICAWRENSNIVTKINRLQFFSAGFFSAPWFIFQTIATQNTNCKNKRKISQIKNIYMKPIFCENNFLSFGGGSFFIHFNF